MAEKVIALNRSGGNITVVKNAVVTFSNGAGTYTNSAIKSTSVVFATRKLNQYAGFFITGNTTSDGSVTFYGNQQSGGSEFLDIVIFN